MPPAKKKPKINAGKNVHGASKEKSLEQTTEMVGLSNTVSKENVDKDMIDRRKTYIIHKDDTLNVTSDFQEEPLDVAEKATNFTEERKEKVEDEKSGKNAQKSAPLVQEANDQDAIPKKRGRKNKVVTEPSAAHSSEMTTDVQIKSDKPLKEETLKAKVSDDSKPMKRGRKKKSDSEAGDKATSSGKGKTQAVDGPISDKNSTKQSEKQKDKEYDKADNSDATDLQKKPAKRGRKKKNP